MLYRGYDRAADQGVGFKAKPVLATASTTGCQGGVPVADPAADEAEGGRKMVLTVEAEAGVIAALIASPVFKALLASTDDVSIVPSLPDAWNA